MKRTLKSIFLTLLLAAIVVPVVAQPQRGQRDRQQMREFQNIPHEVRAEAQVAVFDEYLNLTDSQEADLIAIDAEFAEKGEALREEPMSRQRKRLAAKDLRNEHQQAIHEILSKEQYAVFLENREAIQVEIRQRLKAYSENGNK